MNRLLIPVGMLLTTLALLAFAGFLVFAERRLLGFLQNRLGPNRLGPFGIGQAVADALKLMGKEDFVPRFAHRVLYRAAPLLVAFSILTSFAVIPLDGHLSWAGSWNIGLLFILAMGSLNAYGVFLGGWASGNKFSLLGGIRAVAQLISYELPLGLAVLAIVMLSGSLSLNGIVHAQRLPYIVLQPLGFIIFLIAGMAETHRLPFDLPEAESELVSGFNTEYGGMRFGLFFLGEYLGLTLVSALVALLYLGGWHGPWANGWWWMLLKTLAFIVFFIWTRASLPRLRYDQLMTWGWKALLPLALLNLVVTALIAGWGSR